MTAEASPTFFMSHLEPRLGIESSALLLREQAFPDALMVCLGGEVPAGASFSSLGSKLTGLGRWRTVIRARNWKPETDVVIAVGVWAAAPLLLSRRRNDVRIIVWEHSITREKIATSRGLKLLSHLARFLYKRAEDVVAVSPDHAEQLRQILRLKNVQVIPNPIEHLPKSVDASSPLPLPLPPNFIGEELERILSVGSLTKTKNHELVIRSMATLPDHFRLVVAGAGPRLEDLQGLISELGIQRRVFLAGFIEDVDAYYEWADVVAQGSLGETFGLVMFEAGLHRRPVVAVDYPHAEDLIPRVVPGATAGGNPESFAHAIEDLASTSIDPQAFDRFDQILREQYAPAAIESAWLQVLAQSKSEVSDAR